MRFNSPCPWVDVGGSLHPLQEGLQLCDACFFLLYLGLYACACALFYPICLSPPIPDRDCGYSWRMRAYRSGLFYVSNTCTCDLAFGQRTFVMASTPWESGCFSGQRTGMEHRPRLPRHAGMSAILDQLNVQLCFFKLHSAVK